jgi:hypothetical protein
VNTSKENKQNTKHDDDDDDDDDNKHNNSGGNFSDLHSEVPASNHGRETQ